MTGTVTESAVPVQALRQASLTEEQVRAIHQQGEEAVVFTFRGL